MEKPEDLADVFLHHKRKIKGGKGDEHQVLFNDETGDEGLDLMALAHGGAFVQRIQK